jgi:putative membrane protein
MRSSQPRRSSKRCRIPEEEAPATQRAWTKRRSWIRRSVAQTGLGLYTRGLLVKGGVHERVRGLENVPARGATLIVARHVHHAFDGAILEQHIPRDVHVFVGLDWVESRTVRTLMERLCAAVGWPVALRPAALAGPAAPGARSAYSPQETFRYLQAATRRTVELLRAGELVVIFPEGFPDVDPKGSRKFPGQMLPFQDGFARFIELAERDSRTQVAVVPAGFSFSGAGYRRPIARFGEPLRRAAFSTRHAFVAEVERRVAELSPAPPAGRPRLR